MTRRTSIEAYRTIESEGLLSRRRWEVYDFVYRFGPVTAKQIWKAIAPNAATGSVTTRCSELQRMGILEEVGETADAVTGMQAILWDVTDALPRKEQKVHGPTKRQIISRLRNLIEEVRPFIKPQTDRSKRWLEQTASVLDESKKIV